MLTPGSSLPEVSVLSFQDKLIHFVIFFVLAYLSVGLGIREKKGSLAQKAPLDKFHTDRVSAKYWFRNRSTPNSLPKL